MSLRRLSPIQSRRSVGVILIHRYYDIRSGYTYYPENDRLR